MATPTFWIGYAAGRQFKEAFQKIRFGLLLFCSLDLFSTNLVKKCSETAFFHVLRFYISASKIDTQVSQRTRMASPDVFGPAKLLLPSCDIAVSFSLRPLSDLRLTTALTEKYRIPKIDRLLQYCFLLSSKVR